MHRARKNTLKYCENYVFVWKLSHSHVLFCFVFLFVSFFVCVCVCCLPHSRTKDHNYGRRTIEHGRLFSNYKQNT